MIIKPKIEYKFMNITEINQRIRKLQLHKREETVGKTIESTCLSYDDMYIKFTDGTFTCLTITNESIGRGYGSDQVGVCGHKLDATSNILVTLDIITDAEWNYASEEEKQREYEAREQEILYVKQQEELSAKEEYEKLKKRFYNTHMK